MAFRRKSPKKHRFVFEGEGCRDAGDKEPSRPRVNHATGDPTSSEALEEHVGVDDGTKHDVTIAPRAMSRATGVRRLRANDGTIASSACWMPRFGNCENQVGASAGAWSPSGPHDDPDLSKVPGGRIVASPGA